VAYHYREPRRLQVERAVAPTAPPGGILSHAAWPDASEPRIGLGCMRLSGDGADDAPAYETIAAAVRAGLTLFDTARSYQANERLLARALRSVGAEQHARIVTKGGMTRAGGAWVPDGRAKAIRGDCEASLAALDGLPIDLYLLHAPDARTPWATSVRALARLLDEGLVRRVGLSNVTRSQLDEALELVPVAAIEVALSVYDDHALRSGIVQRCSERGIGVIAHSPLGGPRRAGRLARRAPLAEVAERHGVTAAEVALAWLLGLSPGVVAIPGARRPESARSAAAAAAAADRERLARAFGEVHHTRPRPPTPADGAEVVLVVGIPGAGKSRVAGGYTARGYVRLSRDERGGTLRELAEVLEAELSAGARRVVLDSTYLTRAARNHVIEAAGRHRIPVRCLLVDTPLAQAQVNLVQRLLERFGALPTPDELRGVARREPGMLMPTSQMRALRELEPPSLDEGFASLEMLPFVRDEPSGRAGGAVLLAAAALRRPHWERALQHARRDAPHLVFDWNPDGEPDTLAPDVRRVAGAASGPVHGALCPHGAGPPSCWCRPPLPGLPLAFARAHGLDLSRCVLIGAGPAHRTLAATLGARYVQP